MATCSIATSIDSTCDKARRVGGLAQKVWLVDNFDGFSATISGAGYVTALAFSTYGGLVTMEGVKNSHSAGTELSVTGEGGNKLFTQTVSVKCIAQAPTEIGAIDDLLGWSAPIIVETRNREFYIYGLYNGMDLTALTSTTGQVANTDVSDIMTFTGEENYLRQQVLITDYATTLAYLVAAEI